MDTRQCHLTADDAYTSAEAHDIFQQNVEKYSRIKINLTLRQKDRQDAPKATAQILDIDHNDILSLPSIHHLIELMKIRLPHPDFWGRDDQKYCVIGNWSSVADSNKRDGTVMYNDLDLARCLWTIVILASKRKEPNWHFEFAASTWENALGLYSGNALSMSRGLEIRRSDRTWVMD